MTPPTMTATTIQHAATGDGTGPAGVVGLGAAIARVLTGASSSSSTRGHSRRAASLSGRSAGRPP